MLIDHVCAQRSGELACAICGFRIFVCAKFGIPDFRSLKMRISVFYGFVDFAAVYCPYFGFGENSDFRILYVFSVFFLVFGRAWRSVRG